MADLITFAKSIKNEYTSLSKVNKWITGIPVTYIALKTSFRIIKPIIFKIKNVVSPSRKTGPTDPRFNPDKIYLHMFPRKVTKQVPNLSPFAIKVETWLRLHGKQYEPVETFTTSESTDQIPYIYHNGQEVADSSLIIEYLEGVIGADSSEELSAEQRGIARAFTKLSEESLVNSYCLHRYCYDYQNFKKIFSLQANPLTTYLIDRSIPKDLLQKYKTRGIGRKTPSQVYQIGQDDIRAISGYLGNKQYMMGDKMTKVDCAIFGQLSQIVFVDFHYPHMDFIREHCPNILPYMERIKAKCWPDWDNIVPAGHFD